MHSPSILPQRTFKTSLLRRALIQSVLLGAFIVGFFGIAAFLLLYNVSQDIITGVQGNVPEDAWASVFTVLQNHGLLDGSAFRSTLVLIGVLMILCTAAIGFLLARSLTEPIRSLTTKVRHLSPGTWNFKASVRTGDEVEMLDRTVADLAGRLKAVYDHLEKEVADRTTKLKEQYALDRAVLESVGQGVICTDHDARIVAANPAALSMMGMDAASVLGKRAKSVLPLRTHPSGKGSEEHFIERCLRTRKEVRSTPEEHANLDRRDGTVLPVLVLVAPLVVGKTLRGTVAVLQDMSQERQIEYLKSEFISLASHQLRTPLSSLRWYSELLREREKDLSADQRDYVREIASATNRMLNLLNALLHAARLEDREMEPHFADIDLREIVRASADEAKRSAAERGIACTVKLPPSAVRCTTDATLLGVILQNLLSNATKYTPKGKALRVELRHKGRHAEIMICDEGMGIPAHEAHRVFQKFFRATNVRQADTDGSGLGLYISKSIADRLGGTMQFQSEEGKGSTFTVSIPLGKTTA
jgi:PAS domain S-box-containing protein